jgi:hypothetical protein
MFVDDSGEAADTSAIIVLSKLLATNDDLYTSTEYTWLLDMVNYTLQVIREWGSKFFFLPTTIKELKKPKQILKLRKSPS